MDVDATRIATTSTSNTSKTPSSPKYTLDADGRVVGDRSALMAAGACLYCHKPGHMIKVCPALAQKEEREKKNGTYTPLSRPNPFRNRSSETSIGSSGPPSPAPSYAPSHLTTTTSPFEESDSGF
jgi:hypothetical protein